MARPRLVYRCSSCRREHVKWGGQCAGCGEWNTLEEAAPEARRGPSAPRAPRTRPVPIAQIDPGASGEARTAIGIEELDRVLGGGLVQGSLSLLGGDPGVGKSTLLLAALSKLADRGVEVLYVTGEESARQVGLRAQRLGVRGERLYLLAETDLSAIRRAIEDLKPKFLVLDSVQVLRDPRLERVPGSISQVRAVADQAMEIAKGLNIATFLVGHVTREGTLAGPKMLEHLVDTVLYFECDGRSPIRVLRAVKNRFGSTGEAGLFEMKVSGLVEVPDASARLLAERALDAAGTAVACALEGSRPLLCEIQALAGRPTKGSAGRTTLGVERGRITMLLAVLDKLGVPLSDRDVYVSAAGGLRLSEPAVDLAATAALVSSLWGCPLPPDMAFFGEVGLVGEVRAVAFPELRLREARRHGFRTVVCPPSAAREAPEGLEVIPIRRVSALLDLLIPIAGELIASSNAEPPPEDFRQAS